KLAGQRINPLVAKAFAGPAPGSLDDVAKRYGKVLNDVEKAGRPAPDDTDRLELRRVFHGPDAPPDVVAGLFSDLELLPDRPAPGVLKKLQRGAERWRATGPGAPPRAMVLVDAKEMYEPAVFRRGSPNNIGERVPRRLPALLARGKREAFREGSGR